MGTPPISITSGSLNESTSSTIDDEVSLRNILEELISTQKKHPKHFIVAHINTNSVRYKFSSIQELLIDKMVDLLFIAESKIDASFTDSQFTTNGYPLWRKDSTVPGGGLMAFLRLDLQGTPKPTLEPKLTESIEVKLIYVKWIFTCAYKPPNKK